ncbi:MBL fold metallo-hydrolase, partial [Spirosoma flavum]
MPFLLYLLLLNLLNSRLTSASRPSGTMSQKVLARCWAKQVEPLGPQYLQVSYQEQRSELEHTAEPWQQTPYQARGTLWINATHFRQVDTLYSPTRKKVYYAKTQADPQTLLLLEPGEDKLATVSPQRLAAQLLAAARYSPIWLLDYAHRYPPALDPERSSTQRACYQLQLNQTRVRLFIRHSDGLLDQVTLLEADPMLGDLLTTITYQEYRRLGHSWQPTRITIDKVNGRLHDQVLLAQAKLTPQAPVLLQRPADYALTPVGEVTATLHSEKYSDHIYFITLPHTDDRVMLVEFTDFLLVAEAPLSSQNGELIIQQVRQLVPAKPIRYFVAGHHHPHYLGGVRPFVHRGATILSSPGNEAYIHDVTAATHQLSPDSLALAPKPLKLESVGAHKTITDGQFRMEIYHMGPQSAHTNDYLIYYFPDQQLLFEDDLVWLPKTGKP